MNEWKVIVVFFFQSFKEKVVIELFFQVILWFLFFFSDYRFVLVFFFEQRLFILVQFYRFVKLEFEVGKGGWDEVEIVREYKGCCCDIIFGCMFKEIIKVITFLR